MTKPQKYVAFLRAVNVGGRTIKMDALRQAFASMGFTNVETFIASGNVIFDVKKGTESEIVARIETGLKAAFGFEIPTILRSVAELAAVASFQPFPELASADPFHALYVVFLPRIPSADAVAKLVGLRTEFDEFRVHDRELYWLCRVKISDSKVTGSKVEKAAGMFTTARNQTTVRKLAAKYGASVE